jgi:hypothetical protein
VYEYEYLADRLDVTGDATQHIPHKVYNVDLRSAGVGTPLVDGHVVGDVRAGRRPAWRPAGHTSIGQHPSILGGFALFWAI